MFFIKKESVSEETIKQLASSTTTYRRGYDYYRADYVSALTWNDLNVPSVEAEVFGSDI